MKKTYPRPESSLQKNIIVRNNLANSLFNRKSVQNALYQISMLNIAVNTTFSRDGMRTYV